MLSEMMKLKKMKTTRDARRESISRTTLEKIKYGKRKGATMLHPKKAILQTTICHVKSRKKNVPGASMNPILTSIRLKRGRRNKRTTPILKAPPATTPAGRKVRRKRKKVIFHRIRTGTRTQKLIFGTASPNPRNVPTWKLSVSMT